MAWIKTITEAKATGQLAEIYASMRKRRGYVSNIARAASINPPALRALDQLHQALRGPDCVLGIRR